MDSWGGGSHTLLHLENCFPAAAPFGQTLAHTRRRFGFICPQNDVVTLKKAATLHLLPLRQEMLFAHLEVS